MAAGFVASLLAAPPATVAAEDRSTWTDEQRRQHGRSLWPDRSDEDPALPTVELHGRESKRRSMLAPKPASIEWPDAGEVTVTPGAPDRVSRRGNPGGLPVTVAFAGDQSRRTGASAAAVRVEVADRATTYAAGVDGVLLTVTPTDGAGVADRVELTVDYSSFAGAYGGDWASRLRLVRLPDCDLTAAGVTGCDVVEPLASTNDAASQTVTATVTVAEGTMLALSADTSGGRGDWAATPLSASATWNTSAQTGNFSWSYPLRVPPSVGGPAPDLALSYSSGSVDGRVASTNNQTSWVGDGWDLWPGYVERKYASCADDGTGSANNVGRKTGDLCWKTDNATLMLNGKGLRTGARRRHGCVAVQGRRRLPDTAAERGVELGQQHRVLETHHPGRHAVLLRPRQALGVGHREPELGVDGAGVR
jgi:hypothetical protein